MSIASRQTSLHTRLTTTSDTPLRSRSPYTLNSSDVQLSQAIEYLTRLLGPGRSLKQQKALNVPQWELNVTLFITELRSRGLWPSGPANLHKRICLLRIARGLTQSELGEKCKVWKQAVSQWERGAKVPSYWTLLELCHALMVDANVLCDYRPME